MNVNAPIWFWVCFNAFIIAALAFDLGVFGRRAHTVQFREAVVRCVIWIVFALLFAAGLYWRRGGDAALTFLTGYLIEQSLSVDNIFVMVVIFAYFKVPSQHQHRVLFWGILGAIVMRGAFIVLGTWLLNKFHFVVFLLGGLLVLTALKMIFAREETFDAESSTVVRVLRRLLPVSNDFDGKHFFTRIDGRRAATPLLLVLGLIEVTDLVFAIDSIPAIFAVTRDSFLIYTSNIFAILGLRSMYFLVSSLVASFRFLRYGLAVILAFVGLKMIGSELVHVPTVVSLGVILGSLLVSGTLSVIIPKPKEAR